MAWAVAVSAPEASMPPIATAPRINLARVEIILSRFIGVLLDAQRD
jgi:hypothetical protein